ncbi:hypothetical protein RhiirA5_498118 [Rhizophagus irregularis]|uniref:Phosphatidylglycerol/phosphatidylinositol transfer protein n=1 Tax=Rhizophagus irregularis TaxID=588596 RepID=A0A2N0PVN2_9GLOM|nr:hypothetical protein RhiirA5_498118 [Rhizophagus irregularis]
MIVDISRFASETCNVITAKRAEFRQFKQFKPPESNKPKRNCKNKQNMVSAIEREVFMSEDQLNGFTQCKGSFANSITLLSYTPNPVVTGQNVTSHLAGTATEIIKQGATIVYTAYFKDEPTKEAFQHKQDFCEVYVKQSGSECPVKKGDYSFTASWLVEKHPDEPKNLVVEYYFNISVFDSDGKSLSCINGPTKISYS